MVSHKLQLFYLGVNITYEFFLQKFWGKKGHPCLQSVGKLPSSKWLGNFPKLTVILILNFMQIFVGIGQHILLEPLSDIGLSL